MENWFNIEQLEIFPKEIFQKALSIYKKDHESFFTKECLELPTEPFLLLLHKVKSGAVLLGFGKLCSLIDTCEESPENMEMRLSLGKSYEQTMLIVEHELKNH